MTINWGALGVVTVVSFIVGVLVVVLVSCALLGLSAREPAAAGEPADEALAIGGGGSDLSRVTGTVVAAVCPFRCSGDRLVRVLPPHLLTRVRD